jgi:hypothetical protein
VLLPNKSLQRAFDPLPIFAAAKPGIASNAANSDTADGGSG